VNQKSVLGSTFAAGIVKYSSPTVAALTFRERKRVTFDSARGPPSISPAFKRKVVLSSWNRPYRVMLRFSTVLAMKCWAEKPKGICQGPTTSTGGTKVK